MHEEKTILSLQLTTAPYVCVHVTHNFLFSRSPHVEIKPLVKLLLPIFIQHE